mmetsp:Transcript_79374/g.157274  ORF Transcript_79374/g.157274 Transcript_79374/m.157274 type:complete len:359 (+) Transcript_79374:138-1214(+)
MGHNRYTELQEEQSLGAGCVDNHELSERIAAHQRRKESRREARRRTSNADLLSNVPEVDQDIPFRFNFIAIGSLASHAAHAACSSAVFGRSPRLQEAASNPNGASPKSARTTPLRCLCAVSDGAVGEVGQRLVKMTFEPVTFSQQIPRCSSRLEALSTAMVFVLCIDQPSDDHISLEEQLVSLAGVLEQAREETQPRLRPVRAVILCTLRNLNAEEGGTGSIADEPWAVQLADFQQVHGNMWMFGPIHADDGTAIHAAFTEMASVRIAKVHLSGELEDQGHRDETGEEEGKEEGGDDGWDEQNDDNGFLKLCQPRRRSSSKSSACSEGWQRPPVFEAEADGSACSEDALKRHAEIFGP